MNDAIWIHYTRPRTRWYELEEPARQEHLARFERAREESVRQGGRRDGVFHIRGSGDFSSVEIWRFADAGAAFAHWSRMTEAGYARWFAFANNIGLNAERFA